MKLQPMPDTLEECLKTDCLECGFGIYMNAKSTEEMRRRCIRKVIL